MPARKSDRHAGSAAGGGGARGGGGPAWGRVSLTVRAAVPTRPRRRATRPLPLSTLPLHARQCCRFQRRNKCCRCRARLPPSLSRRHLGFRCVPGAWRAHRAGGTGAQQLGQGLPRRCRREGIQVRMTRMEKLCCRLRRSAVALATILILAPWRGRRHRTRHGWVSRRGWDVWCRSAARRPACSRHPKVVEVRPASRPACSCSAWRRGGQRLRRCQRPGADRAMGRGRPAIRICRR